MIEEESGLYIISVHRHMFVEDTKRGCCEQPK